MQTFFDVNRLFLNFRRKDDLQFLRQRFDGICDVECFIFTHAYIYIYIYVFEFVLSIDIPQRCARMRICGTCKRSASVCVLCIAELEIS